MILEHALDQDYRLTCYSEREPAISQAGIKQEKKKSMSKHEEADLILKLYDLRREPTMRIGRDYFFRDFNPESMADISNALISEHSRHLRMVVSY